MSPQKISQPKAAIARWAWIFVGLLALLLCLPAYVGSSLWYWETKGPFKNRTQVLDLEGDGDLDILVSHARWEEVDISWSGVGRWMNRGDGSFELVREPGTDHFAGSAAGAGDVDQDGDADVFVHTFVIRLLENQGGLQGGEPGRFIPDSGINLPPAAKLGYRDMGGSIEMGDLNADGWVDAFVAGCCYGLNPVRPGNDMRYAPSVSWVWINDGGLKGGRLGHILSMDSLDGLPIQQAALGDLDGDGDTDIFAAVGLPTLRAIETQNDRILLNDGEGNLEITELPGSDTDSTSVALGDVNQDGRLDALVGTANGAKLWINQAAETSGAGPVFVPTEETFAANRALGASLQAGASSAITRLTGLYLPYGSTRTTGVFLSDFDGDGDLDALVARTWEAEIWWNAGQGEYLRSDTRIGYREDTGLAVGDFDGDGDQDIFTGSNERIQRLWWNDGQGNFKHKK